MTILIDKDVLNGISAPFGVDRQMTVYASGLAGADYVEIQVVRINAARTASCECPPAKVTMPEVVWSTPLTCCGTAVRLTPAQPFVLIDFPQGVSMRAVLHSTDPDVSDRLVWVEQTNTAYPTDRMRGCPCS